ncbi:MAG: PEP-CTERM sorting domain-containing protein [bacterium]|nr:PEP-CTERM sorting domain-containing protein [bacterium]
MGSVGTSVRQAWGRGWRRFATHAAIAASLLLGASAAQASPFIPFDAATASDGFSYGFVDPGSHGITTFRQMDDYYTAGLEGVSDASEMAASLLQVDPVSYERCPRSSDGCDSEFHVFDVKWDVTLNAAVLPDPSGSHLIDLILVDSDPHRRFRNNLVTVDYAQSARLDGAQLGFQTAIYGTGAYHFLDLALGSMVDGETKRLAFTYVVEGELPLAGGGDVGFLFPTILPAAFVPIPEPGTVTLLGLGLTTLALRRRRQ